MTRTKLQRTILAAGAAAALLAPVAVAAPGKRAPKQRAEYRNPTVSYIVRGQVDGVEVADKTVAVAVAKSNRHGPPAKAPHPRGAPGARGRDAAG